MHSGPLEKVIVRSLPQLSRGKRRCRSGFCCLQTPGRAGCHQVDKVSHFARRQDYSQGQRLKWLLFELQSPNTRTRREREKSTCTFPDTDILLNSLFAQRSQPHQTTGTYAPTTGSTRVTKRHALRRRLRNDSLFVHKALVWRNTAPSVPRYSECRWEQDLPLQLTVLFLFVRLSSNSGCCNCSYQNKGQSGSFARAVCLHLAFQSTLVLGINKKELAEMFYQEGIQGRRWQICFDCLQQLVFCFCRIKRAVHIKFGWLVQVIYPCHNFVSLFNITFIPQNALLQKKPQWE